MRATVWGVFLALLSVPVLFGQEPDDEDLREAATKAVALLQQSCLRVAGMQTCFTCHHAGLPALALQRAREHGVPVNEEAAREVALKAFKNPDTENLVSLDLAIQGPEAVKESAQRDR